MTEQATFHGGRYPVPENEDDFGPPVSGTGPYSYNSEMNWGDAYQTLVQNLDEDVAKDGPIADRPSPGAGLKWYYATDEVTLYYATGSSWIVVANGGGGGSGGAPLMADVFVYDDSGTITVVERGTADPIATGDATAQTSARQTLQTAIDSTPEHGDLYVQGDYSIDTTPLTVGGNKTLRGDATLRQPNADNDLIHIRGTVGSYQTLNSDVTAGSGVIPVPDPSVFGEGDLIEISKQVSVSPSDSDNHGEIERVESADASSVYVNGPLLEGYPTADGARVRPITPESARIIGLRMIGPSGNQLSGGIDAEYCTNTVIKDVDIKYFDNFGVRFDSCYNSRLSEFRVEHAQRDRDGGDTGYGVWYAGGSNIIEISHGKISGCRHATAGTGGDGAHGKAIRVVNVDARQPEDKTVANHLYDSHTGVYELSFIDCTAELVADYDIAFVSGARRTIIKGCEVKGKEFDTGNGATHFYEPRGDMQGCTLIAEDNFARGIRGFRLNSSVQYDLVRLSGNVFVDGDFMFDHTSGIQVDQVEITENVSRGADDSVIEVTGDTRGLYQNNTVINCEDYPFVFTDCTDLVIEGNTFRASSNDAGIFLDGSGTDPTGVTASYIARNVAIPGSTGNGRIVFENVGSGNRYVANEGYFVIDGSDQQAGAQFRGTSEPSDWKDGDIWFDTS
jgi:hypothetical protein